MTRHELSQIVANQAKLFKGHVSDKGDLVFPTAGQATMFAQAVVWDLQVEAYLPDNMDIEDTDVKVTVKGR